MTLKHFFVFDDPSDEEICRECGVTRDRVESSMHTSDCPGEDTMLLEKLDDIEDRLENIEAGLERLAALVLGHGKLVLAIQDRLRDLEAA
jgi:archaellum component FlaC